METSTVSMTVTPLQLLISLVFQVWLIVFPIILIRKINYLTRVIEEQLGSPASDSGEESN